MKYADNSNKLIRRIFWNINHMLCFMMLTRKSKSLIIAWNKAGIEPE